MAGFFSKIFGGGETGPDLSAAQKPFMWLARQRPGIAKRLANYIVTGDDKSSLLALGTIERRDYKDDNSQKLEQEFLRSLAGQPVQIARFCAVCVALDKAQNTRHYNYMNVKDGQEPNDHVMRLVTLLSRHAMHETSDKDTLQYADFRAAVEHLGGDPSDLVVFYMGPVYGVAAMSIGGTKLMHSLAAEPVEVHLKAHSRVGGPEIADMLEKLADVGHTKDPSFIEPLINYLGHGSANVRTKARILLGGQDPANTEGPLLESLSAGQAKIRAEAAVALGEAGTETALAALAARADVEKADSVKMILDRYLSGSSAQSADTPKDGYIDVNGASITPSDCPPLTDDGSAPLTDDDLAELLKLVEQKNVEIAEKNAEIKREHRKYRGEDPITKAQAVQMVEYLNSGIAPKPKKSTDNPVGFQYRFNNRLTAPWVRAAIDRIPLKRALRIALRTSYDMPNFLSPYGRDVASERARAALHSGQIDIRHVLQECLDLKVPLKRANYGRERTYIDATEEGLIELLLESRYWSMKIDKLGDMLIKHTDRLISELPPTTKDVYRTETAIEFLGELPSLPQAAVHPLMLAALDDRVKLREVAAPLFKDLPDVDEKLVEFLNDKRQATRTYAANYLAGRAYAPALKHIEKRLKKEKSEQARAAMISAIAALGGKTDAYLSRAALEKEGAALAAKLPNAKIEWLQQNMAPALKWNDGKPCSAEQLDGWLRLATKLKTAGDVPLFGLYLDQLEPASAKALGDWVLQSWVAYDSYRRPYDELRAEAREQAESYHNDPNGYSYYKNMTLDALTTMLLSYRLDDFPNSGSDSKGILALARQGTDQSFANNIAKYLKNFGKRVSQSKSLLDVLAVQGSKESVQVLVATATRFKQATVRERAEELLAILAEERGWTREELAERSVPSGGIDDTGVMELMCGEPPKPYTATLGDDLLLTLTNPDGKVVKGLPAGKDDDTKASKKMLSETKKTLKTVEKQQSTRFFEAMVSDRKWTVENWQTDIIGHPVLKRLAQRIVWRGLDADNKFVAAFRPTPEGELVDAAGDDVDLSKMVNLGIMHSTQLDAGGIAEWAEHLDDFEVAPLFQQISDGVYVLPKEDENKTEITDRTGWLTDTFTLRGTATKAGFDRGPIEDGAGFDSYIKTFNGIGMKCVLEFTGSYVPEDNLPAAVRGMHFVSTAKGQWDKLKLGKVPPILLAEMYADLLEMTKTAAFDTDWQKKGLW